MSLPQRQWNLMESLFSKATITQFRRHNVTDVAIKTMLYFKEGVLPYAAVVQ